jgi:tRNA modification GTPase
VTATHGDAPADRASLLTSAGRGAVAVVAAAGPAALAAVDAHFRAANRLPLRNQPINRIVFGHWTTGDHREEIVVCRTDDARVEVHCHGGVAAAERILAALAKGGCQVVPWSDWVGADAECILDAEVEIALAAATTRRTAAILLDQRGGALRAEIDSIQHELAAASPTAIERAGQRIAALLDRSKIGLRLTRPWHVAIAGRPNVGKSSLLNALAGYQRAIVYDQPGTTRDVLTVETAIDGWPVRLTDAAGLRATDEPLEAAGVLLAKEQLERAELVVWLLDATTLRAADLADPDAAARREFAAETAGPATAALLAVVNKTDLVAVGSSCAWVGTSARTGAGVDELLAGISRRLMPEPLPAGMAVPFTSRQVEHLCAAGQCMARGDAACALSELALVIRDARPFAKPIALTAPADPRPSVF